MHTSHIASPHLAHLPSSSSSSSSVIRPLRVIRGQTTKRRNTPCCKKLGAGSARTKCYEGEMGDGGREQPNTQIRMEWKFNFDVTCHVFVVRWSVVVLQPRSADNFRRLKWGSNRLVSFKAQKINRRTWTIDERASLRRTIAIGAL